MTQGSRPEHVSRRRILLAGAAASSTLILPGQSAASPWAARALWWLGGVAVSWLTGKILDRFWDRFADGYWANRKLSDVLPNVKDHPDSSPTAIAQRDGTDLRFRDRVIETRVTGSERFFQSALALPVGLRAFDLAPEHMALNWGAATSPALGRDLPDGGVLRGQWWGTTSDPNRRYVVTRTFQDSRSGYESAGFVAIKGRTGFAHEDFVLGRTAEAPGSLVRQLIEAPEAYVPPQPPPS